MFTEVPTADLYLLKHIIHDWDDEKCIQILKNCHAKMQDNGRIISIILYFAINETRIINGYSP